jgi:hypothetical protein
MLDNKTAHWGFTFGTSYTGFNIYKNSTFVDSSYYTAIEGKASPGIFLGPLFNLRITKFLDMRLLLDISFNQRNITYIFNGSPDSSTNGNVTIPIPSSFIELPILFKYKAARINNFRPYIIAGVSAKYDLGTVRKINYNEPHLKIAPFDMYLEVGPGFDFYLPYFKFSIEFKYGNGFTNLLDPENTIYSNPIDELKSNTFMVSFHFEG